MSAPVERHVLGELPAVGPAVVTIGVFDGVHLGHQALAAEAARSARRLGAHAVALILDPHPDEVFRPQATVPRLTSPERTASLLAHRGIDVPLVIRFDRDVASLDPEAFLACLAPGISLRCLVMTDESRFGRGRSGTPALARQIGERRGFKVVVAEIVERDGERVASSRIRERVAAGDLPGAARLLGRAHAVEGLVDRRSRVAIRGVWLAVSPTYRPVLPPSGEYRGAIGPLEEGSRDGGPVRVRVDGDALRVADAPEAIGAIRLTLEARDA